MSGKTEECYWQAFNWLTNAVEDVDASYIGVDFGCDFFSQLGVHFPDEKLMGCLFHFKQAARQKMVDWESLRMKLNFLLHVVCMIFSLLFLLNSLRKGLFLCEPKSSTLWVSI